jgi:hypothetical protein
VYNQEYCKLLSQLSHLYSKNYSSRSENGEGANVPQISNEHNSCTCAQRNHILQMKKRIERRSIAGEWLFGKNIMNV